MAAIVLGAAGAVVGAATPAGPIIGGMVGRALGSAFGGMIDEAVFGAPTLHREGSRLSDLAVQVSTYGKTIPMLYGTARMAGNIVWSRPISEMATTTTSSAGGGKGVSGGGAKASTTTYSYSVSLAIVICSGPIDGVLRIWADAKLLELGQGVYRIYKGDEEQLPDPFIESFEGSGRVPAYRGQAYVVVEDFPLADFGNRIPNFTFEVKRYMKAPDYNGQSAEEMLGSMIMIPGAGEFVYDTSIQRIVSGEQVGSEWAQSGLARETNHHTPNQKSNSLVSLDHLMETCPNLGWVGIVVTWFGTAMDAGACEVLPGVEYKSGARTEPQSWSVAGVTRADAHQVTLENGRPRYGGTPDDASLVRYIGAIRARGLKVMLLPMFFMDVESKPWRGRVTGTAEEVSSFFTKTSGYNAFIMHYANLLQDKVDAFSIGSELVGLTKVMGAPGNFPAVNQLLALASNVRAVLGSGVKLTYAADWSEYHHTDGGWYHLDPLWASPNIDVIGIDAYFPLTNAPQTDYELQPVMDGWTSGEGYDWYYSDVARTVKTPLSPEYAWKNIAWWWSHPHVNPNGQPTGWVPQSKKIWFTEYGFPSVDGATNQPNVFYDPSSSESYFPRFSCGQVDFRAQRVGIVATEATWANSDMVERRFLWTWDARPYPYFPDLRDVWADGNVWITGHWVTGKLGLSSVAAIVAELCRKAGLGDSYVDVSQLGERVEGYVITRQTSAREAIEELMGAFFFDAVESEGVLRFVPRGQSPSVALTQMDQVSAGDGAPLLSITRRQELELPRDLSLIYLNRTAQYQTGTQTAHRASTDSRGTETVSLPVVMTDAEAKWRAETHLYLRWMGRMSYRFYLDNRHAALEPANVVTLQDGDALHTIRITQTLRDGGKLRVDGVAEDAALYQPSLRPGDEGVTAQPVMPLAETRLEVLDLPPLPMDGDGVYLRYAAAGLSAGWRGAVIYRSEDGGANYGVVASVPGSAVIGMAIDVLAGTKVGNRFDEVGSVTVRLVGEGELESLTELALLNGGNAALLGEEVIQFREATLLEPGKYRLSGLLRGRLGTESAIDTHAAGERFILLNGALAREAVQEMLIGLPRLYKGVTVGGTLGGTESQSFTYRARGLTPLAPVHLSGARNETGDLTIRWIRRGRTGADWRDAVDVPLGEAREAYLVEIVDGPFVIRSIETAAQICTYTSMQQISDFSGLNAAVSVRISQLSEKTGTGSKAYAIL